MRLDEGLVERIEQVARQRDRSVSWVVRRAVEDALAEPVVGSGEHKHRWVRRGGLKGQRVCSGCGEVRGD